MLSCRKKSRNLIRKAVKAAMGSAIAQLYYVLRRILPLHVDSFALLLSVLSIRLPFGLVRALKLHGGLVGLVVLRDLNKETHLLLHHFLGGGEGRRFHKDDFGNWGRLRRGNNSRGGSNTNIAGAVGDAAKLPARHALRESSNRDSSQPERWYKYVRKRCSSTIYQ